jgi:hypothetical protein
MIHETCGSGPDATSSANAPTSRVCIPFTHSGELFGACWYCLNYASALSS